MKDLIIGIVLGALVASGAFVYALQIRKVDKLEIRIERNSEDIEKIVQKIGPLPDKLKGKK